MTLRCGLIGLGMMGRQHARVLSHLPGVDLVVVADADGDRYSAAGDARLVPDVDAVISTGIDYAVVAVPTAQHEEAAVRLAESGIPTLIEKPLARDIASSRAVVEAFRNGGTFGAVGHIERFNPALQQARFRLANGDLGAIYQIATRRTGPFPARIADVGVVKDLCTHDIDLTTWIAQSQYVDVAARSAHMSGREQEDLVAVTGCLASGIVTNHLVNWLSPLKERIITITGERGAYVIDTITADLIFYANGSVATQWDAISRFRGVTEGDVIRYAFPKKEPLQSEHEAFRDAVLGDASQIVTLEEGLMTVTVAEAIVSSAHRNQVESIGRLI